MTGTSVAALVDVSLELAPGEFTAVVGRSGCGKSTLLNLAGAMDFPTTGQVFIEGQLTSALQETGLTTLRRTKVGFVFQSFQLLPVLSVVENVEVPLLLRGDSGVRQKALNALASMEIEELAFRMPYQLSGGQMQRVAIARAIVGEPALLLADEPTGNLDSTTGDQILRVLRQIATDRKTTVLMATHSPEAAALADTVVHMGDGRIVDLDRRTTLGLN